MSVTAIPALWDTSIGKKAVMAVTGLVLVAFVVARMNRAICWRRPRSGASGLDVDGGDSVVSS